MALGLALAFLVTQVIMRLGLGFAGLYGQDAYAYYDYAVGPLAEALGVGGAWPPFHWPPGFPLLVALGSLVFGASPWVGQAVSMLGGAAVVAGTVLLASEFADAGGWRLPLLSGLLAAATPQLWQSSQVIMADTAGLAWAVLGMWCLARYSRRPRSGSWLWLATAFLAAAVLKRWHYALMAVLAAGFALWTLAHAPPRLAWRHGVGAAAAALIVLYPLLPTLLAALRGQAQAGAYAVDLLVYRWSPLFMWRRSFPTADGLLAYRLPTGPYYLLAAGHRYYFTAWLGPLLLPGLVWLWRRGPGRAWWCLGGWAALSVGLLAGGAYQNLRFTLAHLPPLAIVAAGGVMLLRARVTGWWRMALAAYVGLGLVLMLGNGARLTGQFAARQAAQEAIARWAEVRVPGGARLMTFQLTATLRHETELETLELWEQTPATLAALPAGPGELYLLLNLDHVREQWSGLSPERNLRWLEANRTLEPLGGKGGYTLFAVGETVGAGSEP